MTLLLVAASFLLDLDMHLIMEAIQDSEAIPVSGEAVEPGEIMDTGAD